MTAATLALVPETATFECPPDHKHDQTSTCYTTHQCRCRRCRAGQNARKSEERRLHAYGRWTRYHRSPARSIVHITVLMRFGYTHELIARAAGISDRAVGAIAAGHQHRVYARVEAAILSVQPTLDDLHPHTRITARGTIRRVQALARVGWSIEALAGEMGITRPALSQRLHTATDTVSVATHREIAALYERLWNTPPNASTASERGLIGRTRSRATALGWLPPLAWDDIDTDEEPPSVDGETVDVIAVEFAVAGHRVELTRDERHLALAQLHARGYCDPDLAQMLCVSDKTIARDREHLGLPSNYLQDQEVKSA